MKNILMLIAVLFITANGFAQYPYNTNIEPNLNKNVKYAQMSETNNPRPIGKRYANKGQYKSVTADVFLEQYLSSVIVSDEFEPVFFDSTNISKVSTDNWSYIRVGNIVNVKGDLFINAIADSSSTTGYLTLPISTTYEGDVRVSGSVVGWTNIGITGGAILGDGDNKLYFRYYPIKIGQVRLSISYAYAIE